MNRVDTNYDRNGWSFHPYRSPTYNRAGKEMASSNRDPDWNPSIILTMDVAMAHYIDGFVFPISRDQLGEYKRVAEAVARIYREHGALDYLEYVGDDMNREGTKSFPDLAAADEDEIIVFGWVVFDSRQARDLVNAKVEADPRMVELIAPLVDPSNPIFDAKRMAYGGFQPLVGSTSQDAG